MYTYFNPVHGFFTSYTLWLNAPQLTGSVRTLPKVSKCLTQRMSLILLDENIVDPAKQAIKIQIAVGTEGLQRLNASTLTDEDRKAPT